MKHRRKVNPFPRILSATMAAVVFAFGFALLTAGPASAADAPTPVFTETCTDESPSFQHGGDTTGFDYEDYLGETPNGAAALVVLVKDIDENDANQVDGGDGFHTLETLKGDPRLAATLEGVDGWAGGWFEIYPTDKQCEELNSPDVPVDPEPTPDRSVNPEREALPKAGATDDAMHDAATGMALGGIVLLCGLAIVRNTAKPPSGRHRA